MPGPILSICANWGPLSSSPQGLCRHTHSQLGCLPITAPSLKINSLLQAGTCQDLLLSQLSQPVTKARPIPRFPPGFKPKAEKVPQQHLPRWPFLDFTSENEAPSLFLAQQPNSILRPPTGPLRPESKSLTQIKAPSRVQNKMECSRRLQGDAYSMPLL